MTKVSINQEKVIILILMHLKKASKYIKPLNNKNFEKIRFIKIVHTLTPFTFHYFSNQKQMK